MAITVSNFVTKVGGKHYDASCYISGYGEAFEKQVATLNTSTILTALIQDAGRYCLCYASDLFIWWASIQKLIKKMNEKKSASLLLGFREDGVDSSDSVISSFGTGESVQRTIASYKYRSIWRIDLTFDENTGRLAMDAYEAEFTRYPTATDKKEEN